MGSNFEFVGVVREFTFMNFFSDFVRTMPYFFCFWVDWDSGHIVHFHFFCATEGCLYSN